MSRISLKGKQRFLLVFFAIITVASPQSQRKHFSCRNRSRSKSCRDGGPAPPHPTAWSALDVVNSFENSINSSRFIRARVYYVDGRAVDTGLHQQTGPISFTGSSGPALSPRSVLKGINKQINFSSLCVRFAPGYRRPVKFGTIVWREVVLSLLSLS